jgi:hypothetical protein
MAAALLAGALLLFAGCEKEKKPIEKWICDPEAGYHITLDFYHGYAISHVTPVGFNTKFIYQFIDNDILIYSNDRLVHNDFDESGFGFSMELLSKDTMVLHFLGLLPQSLDYISDYTFVRSNK